MRAVKGYKGQSELVMAHLTRLLDSCEARGESAIVEGVHLNLSLVLPLMARHRAVVPFLITIRRVTVMHARGSRSLRTRPPTAHAAG
jgi:2-phosphoglycerate kinase